MILIIHVLMDWFFISNWPIPFKKFIKRNFNDVPVEAIGYKSRMLCDA
jgi:hypothetical protein